MKLKCAMQSSKQTYEHQK